MVRRSRAIVSAVVLSGALCAAAAGPLAQSIAPAPPDPVFDVVSIKKNIEKGPFGRPMSPNVRQRPDGGITMIAVPVSMILVRAFDLPSPRYLSGLPSWATYEPYDVIATSTLDVATPDQRRAMLRAMLAERFKLVGRYDRRTFDEYDLVLARADGRLGPGLAKIDADCGAEEASRRAAIEAAALTGERPALPLMPPDQPPPPCRVRAVGRNPQTPGPRGYLLEGEGTIAEIANMLRLSVGGPVHDRTGLTGSYRVSMTYEMFALQRGPAVDPAADVAPSVLVAVPEQLGLKLQRTKGERPVFVVERLERPSEN